MKKNMTSAKAGAAVRRVLPDKTRVTILLDNDILAWYRKQVDNAGGGKLPDAHQRSAPHLRGKEAGSKPEHLADVIRDELRRVG